mgnify:CR=1 FL=1
MKDELTPFHTLSRPHLMKEWLTVQRELAVKGLTVDRDMAGIHQAQGRVQLLDKMLALLEKANESR